MGRAHEYKSVRCCIHWSASNTDRKYRHHHGGNVHGWKAQFKVGTKTKKTHTRKPVQLRTGNSLSAQIVAPTVTLRPLRQLGDEKSRPGWSRDDGAIQTHVCTLWYVHQDSSGPGPAVLGQSPGEAS